MPNKRKIKQQNKSKPKVVEKVIIREQPMSIGAQIGDKLQKLGTSLFTRFMGSGDYTCNDGCYTHTNALINQRDNKAIRMGNDRGTFIFEHSEYIGDVVSVGGGAFNNTQYVINPANPTTFPWLSQLAPNFETYEISGMLVRFVSTSGESVSSTNTAIGTVMGTVTYDSYDTAFTSKQQFLQYDNTVDCRFSENFILGVECDPRTRPGMTSRLYVGNTPAGADRKTYEYGVINIATQGSQNPSNQVIGELYVHYIVKFRVTKDANFVPGQANLKSFSTTNNTPYATVQSLVGQPPIIVNSSTSFTIPNTQPGVIYIIYMTQTATTLSTFTYNAPTITGATNAVILGPITSLSYYQYSNLVGTLSAFLTYAVQATATSVTFSGAMLTGGSGTSFSTDVWQYQIN